MTEAGAAIVPDHITVGELAEILSAPTWKVRRAVDRLGDDIPRAGRYRLIPRRLIGRVAAQIDFSNATSSLTVKVAL